MCTKLSNNLAMPYNWRIILSTLTLSFVICSVIIFNQSINQSKFIFQAMTNNYNIINVTALERLPEKHYAH